MKNNLIVGEGGDCKYFLYKYWRVQLRTSWSFFKTRPFPCLKSLFPFSFLFFFWIRKVFFLARQEEEITKQKIYSGFIFPELETNDGNRKYHFVFFYPQKRLFSKIIIPKPCSKFIPKPFYVFCCLDDVSKVFCNSFFYHILLFFFLQITTYSYVIWLKFKLPICGLKFDILPT